MSENSVMVSREWASRPEDQRFLSMDDLKQSVLQRKNESWTASPPKKQLRVLPSPNGDLELEVPTHDIGHEKLVRPNNWSFGQLCQYADVPAAYVRKLPAELAAINLQWGLENHEEKENPLILAQSNGDNVLRSMTSTRYGRIWDHQVVEAVEEVNSNGRWQIPAASYAASNPKRASTLYASDRDIFIFLVDPENPIEVDGDSLFRGFITWNSEVGSAVFGLQTFLYRYVCDNRIIWGMTNVKEVRIRHTGGAPERFAHEGQRYLTKYAEESTMETVQAIKHAQNKAIPINKGNGDTIEGWLQKRGFTKKQAKSSVDAAIAEQGSSSSVWDIVNGITAYARSIPNTDERVLIEAKAGKLMEEAIS